VNEDFVIEKKRKIKNKDIKSHTVKSISRRLKKIKNKKCRVSKLIKFQPINKTEKGMLSFHLKKRV